MNILVTGGAGAIGSNLVRSLINKGMQVTVIDDLSSGNKSNLKGLAVNLIEASVLDEAALKKAFVENKFSHVFHLAALFANQNSVENPRRDLETNALGTLRILELSQQYAVKKVVYTSSSCVYGNMSEMVEDRPLSSKLDTPYAITKLVGEQYCKFFSSFHGLNTVSARLFNSFGPGEKPGQYRNVIPNFIAKAINGESLVITGTGDESRDFTFVEDVVAGLHDLCFKNTEPGDIFNLGSGKSTIIKELVGQINAITGNEAPVIFKPRRSWDHVLHRTANIDKARNQINYQASTALTDGLRKTYEWLKEYA